MLGASSLSEISMSVSDSAAFNMFNGRVVDIALNIQQQDGLILSIDSEIGLVLEAELSMVIIL